jgi:nucleoside-diphosphate-sugar epimerase
MKVFVTGASGWIGSAVVPRLIQSGHEVTGLARSEESAAKLRSMGALVERGSLDELDVLARASSSSDGVIHLAFIHDFTQMAASAEADRAAIGVIGESLKGSNRPLVIASGVLGLSQGRPATERDIPTFGLPRALNATATLQLADSGVRSSVVRLPPTVHGDGDQGFIATLIEIARHTGTSGYVGEGANQWSAVHRDDAATAFCLALERAAAGSVIHAVADEGVELRTIAETIGGRLRVPVASIPTEDLESHFGWMALLVALDGAASSSLTRENLGWEPVGPTLIEDLRQGHYFSR